MSDVQRLLDEASELPWGAEWPQKERATLAYIIRERETGPQVANVLLADDANLIVHAVNRLPDYEAAVDALERLINVGDALWEDHPPVWMSEADDARAVLRRLRGAA